MRAVTFCYRHHEVKKDFKCQICDKAFGTNGELKKHVSTVHEGKRDFQCQLCDKAFRTNGALKKHVTNVHEGKKDFKCQIWRSM